MKRLVTLSLVVTLVLPLAAQAQADAQQWTTKRWRQIADQAVKNLASEYAAVREQGLKNAIYLAQEHSDKVSMDRAVKRIIRLYQTESDTHVRDLAVAALESIGTERAQSYLRTNVPADKMARTRELIASVVNEQRAQLGATSTL